MPAQADKAVLSANLLANLAALKSSPGGLSAARRIEGAEFSSPCQIEILQARDGSPVLSIGGAIQDSLLAPGKEAGKIVEAGLSAPGGEAWLFGLGGPALLKAALAASGKLTVFEPDPWVARAALSAMDLSAFLAHGRLAIAGPEILASSLRPPLSAQALAHPSSKRRAPALFAGFERLLRGSRGLSPDPGGKPSVMIVGPLGGGSEPMGGFLESAARQLDLRRLLVAWPENFKREAESLKRGPDARKAAALFRASAALVSELAKEFKPSLLLALAQAPLDAEGIREIRLARPETVLAFWFVEDHRRFGYIEGLAAAWDVVFHIQGEKFGRILESWGAGRAVYLPPAADKEIFYPGPAEPRFSSQASFMGAGYPNRLKIMSSLAKSWKRAGKPPEELRIYGNGWSGESLIPHLFEGGRRMSTLECASIFRSSAVNLNIHSGPGSGFDPEGLFVNPRTFEVAAAGGFQIVDFRPLLGDLFPSESLSVIGDPGELPEAVEKALADPELRRSQAEAARAEVLSRHLYRHRLEAVLKAAGAP